MASYTSTLYRIWKSEGVFSVCWPHIHHFVNFTKVEMGLSSRTLNSQQSAQCSINIVFMHKCMHAWIAELESSLPRKLPPNTGHMQIFFPWDDAQGHVGDFGSPYWRPRSTPSVSKLSDLLIIRSCGHSPVYTLDGKNVRELDHLQIYYLSL